jgi:O-antigen/teichoic acid export membrane protein
MTGTALSQALPVAVSPILTRLYTPEEFGVFAIYLAMASILSVLVTGRYELAIMIPHQDRDAIHIAALSAALSVIISGLLLVLVIVFNQDISNSLGAPALGPWLYWLPASTLLSGIYQSLNYWSNRKSKYKRLAISRTVQSGSTSLGQLGAGYAEAGAIGLVGGQLAGQAISTVLMAGLIYRKDEKPIKLIHKNRILAIAKKYIKYPKYMIPGQLFNVISGHAPLFMLSIFFGPIVAGFYSLSQRVLVTPMSLVAGAIGDVYKAESAKYYRKNGNCISIFKSTFIKLFFLALFIALPVLLFGPDLYAFVFGEDWRKAGEIGSLLAVMIFFRGISSPTSETIYLANLQRIDLIWQTMRLALTFFSLYLGYKFFPENYKISILFYVIAFSFLYIIHSFLQYFVAIGKFYSK